MKRPICRNTIRTFFMIDLKVNAGFISLNEKNLEKMMTDNPETREAIQKLIRETMWEARNATAHGLESIVGGSGQSWRAVRNIVFQKVLGGNINILNKKKGNAEWKIIQKTRKVELNPHMRGGNRRRRTLRTAKVEGYEPTARGFILRFQDSGTRQRFIGGRNSIGRGDNGLRWGRMKERGIGNRGSITAGNFFYRIASQKLGEAAEKLAKMIDVEIAKISNQNKN